MISIDTDKKILDCCCGSRMFWFDKNEPHTIFSDIRETEETLCDGRTLKIKPDILADFRELPFPDESFNLVVFDPPHLEQAGEKSWLAKKYGVLNKTWKNDIQQGFIEGMRVLKTHGVLIFKWNEDQIKVKDIMQAIGYKPLFGDRRSKTLWMVFMKKGA